MVKEASAKKSKDEQRMIMEIITTKKRSGADIIITYHALEDADILNNKK
jgi:porphobilinogen synthase